MADTLDYSTITNPYDPQMNRPGPLGSLNNSSNQVVDSPVTSNTASSTSTSGGSIDTSIDPSLEAGGIIKSGATLTDVWIDTWLKSRSYQPQTQGFLIDARQGYIECMKLFVGTGGIVGGSLDIPNTTSTNSFHVDNAGNMWSGSTTLAGAPFSVTNAGVITATSGTIGGNVLGPTSLSSVGFVSGLLGNGWRIQSTGEAEFENITARGVIRTSVFEKDTISSVGGFVLISKADVLGLDMTALDSSTLTVKGTTAFVANEVLRMKDGVNDEWMLVTNAASAPTYTVTRDLAGTYAPNTNPIWKTGTAVVSMGVGTGTKTGFISLDSSSASSPFVDIYGRNSNTYSDYTLHGRFGWLQGIVDVTVGLNNTDVWGLYTDNAFIKGTIAASTITGSTITGGTLQTATSGQRIRLASAAAVTPTQNANSLMLINSSNHELLDFGSQSSVIMRILPVDTSQIALICQNDTSLASSSNLVEFGVTNAGSSGAALSLSNSGSGNGLNVTTDGSGKNTVMGKFSGTANTILEVNQGTNAIGIDLEKSSSGSGVALKIVNNGTGHTIDISQALSSNGNQVINAVNLGNGRAVSISNQDNTNPNSALFVAHNDASAFPLETNGAYIDVGLHFQRCISLGGKQLFSSNGTTPNGNLSAFSGDICVGGDSGKAYYCTGTTNWTAM